MTRKPAWMVMTLSALLIAAYAAGTLVAPVLRSPFLRELFENMPIAIVLHITAGIFAIVIGAFQVNSQLRSRFLTAHRWFGRIYLAAVLVGGIAGLYLSLESFGGLVTHFGFGLMAVCWLGTTFAAYYAILQRDVSAHRTWMLRSYALTLAALTLRIYLPISQIAGIGFEPAYQAISWLCWVPNLLIVEWFILARQPQVTDAA
ncbi:MAG: DUF2306 domain-containing protein [Woeseiaceae bacterium]